MARPLSHASIYDPYSYYSCSPDPAFIQKTSPPSATAQSRTRTRLTRSASIWSTSSICSDDSSLGDSDFAINDNDDDEDDDDLTSPLSPAESTSSRASWSSATSSSSGWSSSGSSSTSRTVQRSATAPGASAARFKRSDKPRGPRPLPTLPTSQPSSPVSPTPMVLPLPKVTPPLRLNLKVVTPPPSYAEAMSAGVHEPEHESRQRPVSFPFDAETDADTAVEFLSSPLEDTIDWARIEEFIALCDG